MDTYHVSDIVADREWIVVVASLPVSSVYTLLKHYDGSLVTCANRGREMFSLCTMQVKPWHKL